MSKKLSLAFGFIIVFALILMSLPGKTAPQAAPQVTITWKGHACFEIVGKNKPGITTFDFVFDPYGAMVGYPIQTIHADATFMTHEHPDHNNAEMVPGSVIIRGLKDNAKSWNLITQTLAPGIDLQSIGEYHDTVGGKERGLDSLGILDFYGIRIVHLGDLGELLSPEKVKEIGPVDVLLIPVGGHYTIDGDEAKKVVAELNPKVVIPMHYKTAYTASNLPLVNEDRFLDGIAWPVEKLETSTLILTKNRLPKSTTVFVLKPLTTLPAHRI